jgi:CRISPR/Cas system-associated exonuclease Cas4 (RecB family)
MAEEIKHLSVSQINMFLRCPMQYEFRYMKGIKIPPVGAIIQGKAYHEAIAADLLYKKTQGNLLTEGQVADAFSTSFDIQLKLKASEDEEDLWEFEDIDWQDNNPGEVKDEGIILAGIYHNKIAQSIEPLEVEEKKQADIEGIPFVFIADVVEEKRIIDHKVKGRRFSEDELKKDLQATAYSLIYNRPLEFHQALKLKVPTIEIAPTARTENDYLFFRDLVSRVKRAIDTGIFYPNPTGWACSEQWCGYYKLCRDKP